MQIKDKTKDVRKFQLIFVYYRKILIIYMQVLQECQPYMYASQMVRVMHKFAIVPIIYTNIRPVFKTFIPSPWNPVIGRKNAWSLCLQVQESEGYIIPNVCEPLLKDEER